MSDEIVDRPEAAYAGRSHVKLRRQRTHWASQFQFEPDGDAEECMAKDAVWLFSDSEEAAALEQKKEELSGKAI